MNVEPAGSNATVTGAIRQAAQMTGAAFKYLLATAQVESNLNPNAQAATSSARGLFQFTEQTWLTTLKEQGAPFGYGPYSNLISRLPSGDYGVSDPRMSDAVLKLRFDPTANALMAGAFTKSNAGKLAGRLGRDATEGELYIAHFLGATGASRLIGLADTQPTMSAAAVFPGAAHANPSIFYDGRGNARSAADVYHLLVNRYDNARGVSPPAAPAVAAAEPPRPAVAFSPDTAGLTETYAAAARLSPEARAANIVPVFHGLFRSSGGSEPVAPVVNSLWTTLPQPDTAPSAKPTLKPTPMPASATPGGAPAEAGTELGLFQDQPTNARALFRGRV
jgi:transglycosylase-like protein with SLT domain